MENGSGRLYICFSVTSEVIDVSEKSEKCNQVVARSPPLCLPSSSEDKKHFIIISNNLKALL